MPVPSKYRSPLITVDPLTVKSPPKCPPPLTIKAFVEVVPVELAASPTIKFLPIPTPPTIVSAAEAVVVAAVSSRTVIVSAAKFLSTTAPPCTINAPVPGPVLSELLDSHNCPSILALPVTPSPPLVTCKLLPPTVDVLALFDTKNPFSA